MLALNEVILARIRSRASLEHPDMTSDVPCDKLQMMRSVASISGLLKQMKERELAVPTFLCDER